METSSRGNIGLQQNRVQGTLKWGNIGLRGNRAKVTKGWPPISYFARIKINSCAFSFQLIGLFCTVSLTIFIQLKGADRTCFAFLCCLWICFTATLWVLTTQQVWLFKRSHRLFDLHCFSSVVAIWLAYYNCHSVIRGTRVFGDWLATNKNWCCEWKWTQMLVCKITIWTD